MNPKDVLLEIILFPFRIEHPTKAFLFSIRYLLIGQTLADHFLAYDAQAEFLCAHYRRQPIFHPTLHYSLKGR